MVPLTVQNLETVDAAGPLTVTLLASGAGGDMPLATITKSIRLKAGATKLLPLRFNFPTLPAGAYSLVIRLDSAGTFGESNESNNTATGGTTFTVA